MEGHTGSGPILNNASGESVCLSAAQPYEILYVNKLAMMIVATPKLGCTSARAIQALGNRNEIEAKMRSAARVRLT